MLSKNIFAEAFVECETKTIEILVRVDRKLRRLLLILDTDAYLMRIIGKGSAKSAQC